MENYSKDYNDIQNNIELSKGNLSNPGDCCGPNKPHLVDSWVGEKGANVRACCPF